MSLNNICDDETDSEFRITEKLKSTGRISLSDITAATIGPLDAETWETDQSDSLNNGSQNPVHRPWASVSEQQSVSVSEQQCGNDSVQPHTIIVDHSDKAYNEANKKSAYISIEPLPILSFKRGLQDDDSFNQKRIRLATEHQQKVYNVPDFQQSNSSSTKQFDFSALSRSFNRPETYTALSSAIKPGPALEAMSDMSVIKSMNSLMNQNLPSWTWAPTKSDTGPYITSIPVGKYLNPQPSASATFPNPSISYPEIKFQPWSSADNQPNQYQPSTPAGKRTSIFETGFTSSAQQYGYATPVNTQKSAISNCQASADSPVFDSRFNDSLTNLLGSPPTEKPISKNPFFSALQNVIESDCKREIVPQTLMDIHTDKQVKENIFTRERALHERFSALQESSSDEVRQLSGFYRYQSALIETERFRTLHECNYPLSYKDTVNKHYDDKLHSVMDRVEQSIVLLENANKENKYLTKGGKPRPHLNKEAVKIMEEWFEQNLDHPYPTGATYDMLALRGNVGVEQVKKWFANKRNRTHNTRTLTEIAMKKRKLNLLSK